VVNVQRSPRSARPSTVSRCRPGADASSFFVKPSSAPVNYRLDQSGVAGGDRNSSPRDMSPHLAFAPAAHAHALDGHREAAAPPRRVTTSWGLRLEPAACATPRKGFPPRLVGAADSSSSTAKSPRLYARTTQRPRRPSRLLFDGHRGTRHQAGGRRASRWIAGGSGAIDIVVAAAEGARREPPARPTPLQRRLPSCRLAPERTARRAELLARLATSSAAPIHARRGQAGTLADPGLAAFAQTHPAYQAPPAAIVPYEDSW